MTFLAVLPLLLAAPQAAAPPAQEPVPARVGSTPLVVRAFHHKSMPQLAELAPGTPVRIVAKREPWARVQVPGGLVVWVYGRYVDLQGDQGILNASHVRARPLPSTGAESYPVGQFLKGDRVTVLGRDGDWLRVRAPESLGGWALLEDLVEYSAPPSDWEAHWKQIAQARLASAGTADADEAGNAVQAPEAAAAEKTTLGSEQGVRQALLQAEIDLAKFANEPFDAAHAAQIQETFGAVLWSSDDPDLVDRARLGLSRLEALQRVEDLRIEKDRRKAELEAEARAAEASARKVASEPVVEPDSSPLASYTLVGWVEYRPRLYSAAPYGIRVGRKWQAVISAGGRFDLGDFRDREVAVRGHYRKGADPGVRVLEVEALRLLPSRSR